MCTRANAALRARARSPPTAWRGATGASPTLPVAAAAKVLPQRTVRVLLIERGGEILFEQRPATGIWGGLWSLPECALDEDVVRALRTRFGATMSPLRDALPPIEHGFTHFRLTLHPQRVAAHRWPRVREAPGMRG